MAGIKVRFANEAVSSDKVGGSSGFNCCFFSWALPFFLVGDEHCHLGTMGNGDGQTGGIVRGGDY